MRKYLQLISQRANLPIQRAPKYSREKERKVIYVKKIAKGIIRHFTEMEV